MKIIELAKESGLYATDNSYSLYAKELQDFATAIIEDYKKSLVPVAYVDKSSAGQISLKSYYSNYFDMSKFIGVSFYALGETK